MKNILVIMCIFFLFFSCKRNSNISDTQEKKDSLIFRSEEIVSENIIESDSLIYLDKLIIPQEHIEFFKKDSVGSFFKAYRLISPIRGIDERVYLINGDIELSFKKIDSLIGLNKVYRDSIMQSNEARDSIVQLMQIEDFAPFQYRTRNLVTAKKTIRIAGANIRNANLRKAIANAISNYNQLDLKINFQFAGWYTIQAGSSRNNYLQWRKRNNIDIVITEVSGTGGRAGFPFNNGLPYDFITIGRGIVANYGVKVAEHVVTHEIGHCVGLRHTDYYNRSISCGRGGDEGNAGIGAIHIPGTPKNPNIDRSSVMLACYNSRVSGEFSNYDKIALKSLY